MIQTLHFVLKLFPSILIRSLLCGCVAFQTSQDDVSSIALAENYKVWHRFAQLGKWNE